MLTPRVTKTFQLFPYRHDFENGRSNIGGIDLTKEPERIDEIHELSEFPRLKQVVYDINVQPTPIMTLGCLIEQDNITKIWHAYFDFCFRNPSVNHNKLLYLDEWYVEDIKNRFGGDFAHQLKGSLKMEYDSFSMKSEAHNPPNRLYSVFVSATNQNAIQDFFVDFFSWIRNLSGGHYF